MSRKSPAFSFYPDSWVMGTIAMSFEEQGLYMRMLCFQWSNGPSNALAYANACGLASPEHINRILSSKFICIDGKYHNERLEEERSKQTDRSKKAKDSANRRWNQKNEQRNNANAMPTHMQTQCEGNTRSDANAMHSVSVSDSIIKERERESRFAESLEIPEKMQTAEFKQAWKDWINWNFAKFSFRLDSLTGQEHLRQCYEWGPDKSVANIRHTIANRSVQGGIWEKREPISSSGSKRKLVDFGNYKQN